MGWPGGGRRSGEERKYSCRCGVVCCAFGKKEGAMGEEEMVFVWTGLLVL